MGFVQRQGRVKAHVVKDIKSATIHELLHQDVKPGTIMMTDEFSGYNKLKQEGFKHLKVNHVKKEYARGIAHTNNIEGFWSQLKRSIDGTHHAVSPKYLQSYVDEFAYRYNLRHAFDASFSSMLSEVVKPVL